MSEAVRRPIARSIFLFIFIPSFLHAQVTPDPTMPFQQGLVLQLPGTSDYLGDFPQDIEAITDATPFHTLSGWLAETSGWTAPGTPANLGFNNGSPAVLFGDIPYPFPSTRLLTWFPIQGNPVMMDFPSSAWWGPSAARGAIQLRPPDSSEGQQGLLGFWSGSQGLWGWEGLAAGPAFSASADWQHSYPAGIPESDTLAVLSGVKWVEGDNLKIKSGLLASQWFSGDSWYSINSSLEWSDANFQSVELKPFFQSAALNGEKVQEEGGYANYHLSLAGLVESILGLGFVRDDFSPSGGAPNQDRGFLQNMEMVDALGFVTLNGAFRWDFSSAAQTTFSTVLGAQAPLGDWLLLGDYSKAVDPELLEDVQQGELGFRWQPEDNLALSGKAVHEQVGNNPWDGGRWKVQFHHDEALLLLFQKTTLEVEGQALQGQTGGALFDTGFEVQWSFFPQNTFWFRGRGISNQPLYAELGADYRPTAQTRVYVSMANPGGFPVSWPDPMAPNGRIFWAGAEYGF